MLVASLGALRSRPWLCASIVHRRSSDSAGRRGPNSPTSRCRYPPRVLVELLVNMLVHRDYELPEPASIETRPGAEIAFSNPGGLTQNLERRIAIDKDGRFKLSESLTDQRNPALCDIFFGISAMERAGTGLIDACQRSHV